MFGVGTGEILLILAIAMLVVGPERMVTFARQLGEWIAKFRQETDSVTAEFREALSLDPEESAATARTDPEPEGVESGASTAQPAQAQPEADSVAPTSQRADVMANPRREVASPFADSEWSETPWPAEANPSAQTASSDADSEIITLDVAQAGVDGDEMEPTLIQEPQMIVDEGEPDTLDSDGEEKG